MNIGKNVKKEPLVSVIIPCYNYGKFLPESIESVLNQTYENIELTILDDGSKDNTKSVAKKYVDKHPNVKYLHQPNKGIVETRNRCLIEATGEYLVMLDADDFLDKNYIEETVKVAEKEDVDIVYTNFKTFGLENRASNFPEFSVDELKNHNYIHISALLRVNKIKRFKFDQYLDKKSHEDWDFFLDLALHGAAFRLCGSTQLRYRIHGQGRNNLISTVKQRTDYVTVYKYIIDKYEKKFPGQLNYLTGRVFADWYEDVHTRLKLQEKHSSEMQKKLENESYRVRVLELRIKHIESRKLYRAYQYIKRLDPRKDK